MAIDTTVENTVRLLEALHTRLLAQSSGAREAHVLMSLATSVPQIAGLIEGRLPSGDAVILTRDQVRELLAKFACDVLSVQADAVSYIDPRRAHSEY